jgi:hypothetical protein
MVTNEGCRNCEMAKASIFKVGNYFPVSTTLAITRPPARKGSTTRSMHPQVGSISVISYICDAYVDSVVALEQGQVYKMEELLRASP